MKRDPARRGTKWTPEFQAEYYRKGGNVGVVGGGSRPLSLEDDEYILRKRGAGMPDAQIAQRLGRSIRAIHIRRSKLKRSGVYALPLVRND